MSAIVRRNRWRILVAGIGMLVMMSFWLSGLVLPGVSHASEAVGDGVEVLPPLEPYRYAQIQKIRQDLALTNLDLASMDCDMASAQAVLRAVRSWVEVNAVALDQTEAAQRSAFVQLQETLLRQGVGPEDSQLDALLPALKQQLDAADQARNLLLQGIVTAVEQKLDSTRLLAWNQKRNDLAARSHDDSKAGELLALAVEPADIRQLDQEQHATRLSAVLQADSDVMPQLATERLQASSPDETR